MGRARKVFVQQLPATLSIRALDAKVQVTFDPEAVASYRLIGYENRAVADEDFRDRTVDGGEVGPGHTVTALYAVRLTGYGDRVARVDVRWLDPRSRSARESSSTVDRAGLDRSFADSSPRLQVCYAAGYLAETLRRGPAAGEVRMAELAGIAAAAAERTEDPAVRELADPIERADRLS